jgi:hypothetical protein
MRHSSDCGWRIFPVARIFSPPASDSISEAVSGIAALFAAHFLVAMNI